MNSHDAIATEVPPNQLLSQLEVDALLAQVAEEAAPTQATPAATAKAGASMMVQPFDFRQPVFLAASELRKLRVHHEEFIRSLAARLSVYLRLDFSLQLSGLTTISFQKYVDSLPSPSHLTLFQVEPLRGICCIDTPPRFALPMVDRLLGGAAQVTDVNRDLSEIEVALLDQIIQIIISEWSNHWTGLQELRPVIVGHETDARFTPSTPRDSIMLAITMDAVMRDCVDQIRIALPYHTIEPLVRKLSTKSSLAAKPAVTPAVPPKWNPKLSELDVPVTVEWDGMEMTARQVASLRPGEVIRLDPADFNSVQVRLARVPKFRAQLGTCGAKWAVELTQVIPS